MKTYTIDGKTVCTYMADRSDGGRVITTFVLQDDGVYAEYREWYQDPEAAAAAYDAFDDTKSRARKVQAEQARGVTVNGPAGEDAASLKA